MAQVSNADEVAEDLVKKLTGFKNGSDNFKRTLQYVLSNFKYHRYLDVDSHKITRDMKGLTEKLQVHSKADKADAVKAAVDIFLHGPLFSTRSAHPPKSDAHYAVLSVLLNLAGSPTAQDYEETPDNARTDGETDFDWGKYLLEDLEPLKDFDEPSSDEWEEEEEVLFPEETLNDSGVLTNQSQHATQNISHSHLTRSSLVTGTVVTSGGQGDRSWFSKNVVVQYWDGEDDRTLEKLHRHAQVAWQWKTHEKECSMFPVIDQRYKLTETHIIRETIWILMGAEKSFIYHRHGNRFDVREDVELTHLTPASLNTMLQSLAKTGSYVLQLQCFVDEMRHSPSSYCNQNESALNSQNMARCQTYEAYAEALAKILHSFRNMLVHLEKTVLLQEEQMTLANFEDHLSTWIPKLQLLAFVHDKAVVNCSQPDCVYRVWYLLKILQESISEHYSMGLTSEENGTLLVQIWLQTIRPYVDFLDRWLTLGHLYDPAREFVIQRNSAIDVKSQDFWQEGFILHRFQTASQPTDQEPGTSQMGGIAVPPSLEPLLRHIVLAGKCMEVLGSVGQLGAIRTETYPGSASMYDQLISSSKCISRPDTSSAVTMATADNVPFSSKTLVVQQLRLPGTTDPLLTKNFDEVLETVMMPVEKAENRCIQADTSLPHGVNTMPLSLVIERCLYPPILYRCNVICQQLVSTLKAKFDLMNKLAILRKFYLLEDGDVMCDFYLDIFERLRRQESWSDFMYLNGQLQEAFRQRYPELIERLTVSVIPSDTSVKKAARPIHALDGLMLHYQVSHPLNILINKQCINTYNKVFRFLLQVKRAKYSLDQVLADLKKETHDGEDEHRVRTPSVDSSTPESELKHRLYLLRFNLMHFVNSIHQYLMTRILHSTGLEFQADLERAVDLDGVLTAHETYLTKVLQRCLLHEKVRLVREAVVKVLNMALVFQRRWHAGKHTFSIESVSKMEFEFHNCNMFLSTLLISMTKRGAFPHSFARGIRAKDIIQTVPKKTPSAFSTVYLRFVLPTDAETSQERYYETKLTLCMSGSPVVFIGIITTADKQFYGAVASVYPTHKNGRSGNLNQ